MGRNVNSRGIRSWCRCSVLEAPQSSSLGIEGSGVGRACAQAWYRFRSDSYHHSGSGPQPVPFPLCTVPNTIVSQGVSPHPADMRTRRRIQRSCHKQYATHAAELFLLLKVVQTHCCLVCALGRGGNDFIVIVTIIM